MPLHIPWCPLLLYQRLLVALAGRSTARMQMPHVRPVETLRARPIVVRHRQAFRRILAKTLGLRRVFHIVIWRGARLEVVDDPSQRSCYHHSDYLMGPCTSSFNSPAPPQLVPRHCKDICQTLELGVCSQWTALFLVASANTHNKDLAKVSSNQEGCHTLCLKNNSRTHHSTRSVSGLFPSSLLCLLPKVSHFHVIVSITIVRPVAPTCIAALQALTLSNRGSQHPIATATCCNFFAWLFLFAHADDNGSTNSVADKGSPAHYSSEHLEGNLENPNFTYEVSGESLVLFQSLTIYDKMGSIQQDSHFKKIQSFKADYADATFTQYESQRTGLRVVVVDRKGPKVYGNFAVATEIHDDSGSRMSNVFINCRR